MKNIINKIRQLYPVSDEALQALQANMQVKYYPKDTYICLLYTSDAADELDGVDLGGRRIIKKKIF